ncbi:MAG: gliding motility lipoprotein GldD [Lentimicrobiaceae bacterium]|nr:gliding motility lipoprotein GldD [Lentimicrobiaceae bacterium]
MKKVVKPFFLASVLTALLVLLFSCNNNYVPKPIGFLRIEFPDKQYQRFDTTFPYSFDYPIYAVVSPNDYSADEKYWINVDFPEYKGKLHISYKTFNNIETLKNLTEDARVLAMKHIPKATGIQYIEVNNAQKNVYGLIYKIGGADVASTYQFYLTDSIKNYLRGALYFSVIPNNDSLSPVINFIEEDINELINTFEWRY